MQIRILFISGFMKTKWLLTKASVISKLSVLMSRFQIFLITILQLNIFPNSINLKVVEPSILMTGKFFSFSKEKSFFY